MSLRESDTMPRALREGVRTREPEAMAELFDRYFGRIYDLVLRLLGNVAAAEDATHDVFLKVHRSASTYDPSRDPGPWLATIAYNVCRDAWRSREFRMSRLAQPLHPGDPLSEALPAATPGPNGEMAKRETERSVSKALMTLPEEQRSVVLLHDFERLSHEEIAPIVGASAAAVRKRYSRALTRMRDFLEGLLQ